jgi:hypothetical protein
LPCLIQTISDICSILLDGPTSPCNLRLLQICSRQVGCHISSRAAGSDSDTSQGGAVGSTSTATQLMPAAAASRADDIDNGRPSVADLLARVTGGLLALYNSTEVVGDAERPAVWLPEKRVLDAAIYSWLLDIFQRLTLVLDGMCVASRTQQGTGGSRSDCGDTQRQPGSCAYAAAVIGCMSFLPLPAPLRDRQGSWWGIGTVLTQLLATCALAQHAELTDTDKDHLALLLGGCSGSGSSDCTLHPSPSFLTDMSIYDLPPASVTSPPRSDQHTLQELALRLVSNQLSAMQGGTPQQGGGRSDARCSAHAGSVAGRLVAALGTQRVHHLAALVEEWRERGPASSRRVQEASTYTHSDLLLFFAYCDWLKTELASLLAHVLQRQDHAVGSSSSSGGLSGVAATSGVTSPMQGGRLESTKATEWVHRVWACSIAGRVVPLSELPRHSGA